MKIRDTAIIFILGFVFSAPAVAESIFKCGRNKIVEKGDSTGVVRSICGAPEYRDSQLLGGGAEIRIEAWGYRNFPDRKWMTELRFKNGKLSEIEGLGRVR